MIQAPPARSLLADSEWPMIFAAAAVILGAAALISIWMSRSHSPRARVLWTAAVILLPVLGALGWFVLGRERKG